MPDLVDNVASNVTSYIMQIVVHCARRLIAHKPTAVKSAMEIKCMLFLALSQEVYGIKLRGRVIGVRAHARSERTHARRPQRQSRAARSRARSPRDFSAPRRHHALNGAPTGTSLTRVSNYITFLAHSKSEELARLRGPRRSIPRAW